MYLQKVQKTSLSPFDDKRCYINEIESIPWNYKSGFSIVCFISIPSLCRACVRD